MSNNGIILAFKAEAVLGADAEIFQRIELLRQRMHYSTEGDRRSFEDYFTVLRDAVDAIPKLELDTDVVPGGENQYSLELAQTMEQIVDDCDRISRKLVHFQGRLLDAERQIQNLRSEFVAWYMLAGGQLLAGLEDVKLPLKELRALADAEFSRLLGNVDVRITTLFDDLKIEFSRVSSHKSAQKEKHELGRDQINASWTSILPSYGGAVAPEASPFTKAQDEEEDMDDDAPAFVSRKPTISAVQQRLNQAKPGDSVIIRNTENVAPKIAEVKEEFKLLPDPDAPLGVCDDNPQPHRQLGPFVKGGEQGKCTNWQVLGPSGDCNLTEIKGTFKKTGDPKPVIAVAEQDPDRHYNKFMAAEVPSSPRRKLVFDEDDMDVI